MNQPSSFPCIHATAFAKSVTVLMLLFACATLQAQQQSLQPAQAVILQYHHIDTSTPASTSISPADFRLHMEYLKNNNFTVLPLEQIVSALRNGSELPDLTAAITFDDGYWSVYESAFPILREFDFPFTVFIASGLIGSNASLYASWDQLREMGAAGATLANHTVTHPYLMDRQNNEDDAAWLARLRDEIVTAESRIMEETGQSHRLLAYPYGEYDPLIQQLVKELDYTGIGQHSGPISAASDFTALPRFPFSGNFVALNSYAVKVKSLAFNVSLAEPLSPLTTETSPSAVLDFDGEQLPRALNCFNNDKPMKVTVLDATEQLVRIETAEENRSRRFRYNCTAPGRDGRYYWFSVPWLNPAIPE